MAELGNLKRAATDAVDHALSTGPVNQLHHQSHVSSPDRSVLLPPNARGYVHGVRSAIPQQGSLTTGSRVGSGHWPWRNSVASGFNVDVNTPLGVSPHFRHTESKENMSNNNFGSDRRPLGSLGLAGGVKISSPSGLYDTGGGVGR